MWAYTTETQVVRDLVDATMLLRYTLAGAAQTPRSEGNTGSEESTSGGVADNAHAARGKDDDEDVDEIHVGLGRTRLRRAHGPAAVE